MEAQYSSLGGRIRVWILDSVRSTQFPKRVINFPLGIAINATLPSGFICGFLIVSSSGSSETFNSSFQVPSSSILRLFFSSVFYFHTFDCRREGCCFHFDPLSVAAVLEGRMNSNSRVSLGFELPTALYLGLRSRICEFVSVL